MCGGWERKRQRGEARARGHQEREGEREGEGEGERAPVSARSLIQNANARQGGRVLPSMQAHRGCVQRRKPRPITPRRAEAHAQNNQKQAWPASASQRQQPQAPQRCIVSLLCVAPSAATPAAPATRAPACEHASPARDSWAPMPPVAARRTTTTTASHSDSLRLASASLSQLLWWWWW